MASPYALANGCKKNAKKQFNTNLQCRDVTNSRNSLLHKIGKQRGNKPTFKYDLHKGNKLLSNTSHKNSNKNVTRKNVIRNQIYLISRDEKGKIVNFGTEVVNKDSFLYIVEMKCY